MSKTKEKKRKYKIKFVHMEDIYFSNNRMLRFRDWEDFCQAVDVVCGNNGVLLIYVWDYNGYLFVDDQVLYIKIPEKFIKERYGFKK